MKKIITLIVALIIVSIASAKSNAITTIDSLTNKSKIEILDHTYFVKIKDIPYSNKIISIRSKINKLNSNDLIMLLDTLESTYDIKFHYYGLSYPSNYNYIACNKGIEYKILVLKTDLYEENIYRIKLTITNK